MTDREIIKLWRSGLTKNKLAEIYRRQYWIGYTKLDKKDKDMLK